MNSYTKLFASILDSSIWAENDQTRLVWITMLAMADQHGEVQASVPGLARRAGVSIEATADAIERLSSPDLYSRTPDHEGRRIAKIDGGWEILNHGKYRRMASLEDRKEKAADRQRRHRERVKGARDGQPDSVTERDKASQSVTRNAEQGVSNAPITHLPDKADADADADSKTTPSIHVPPELPLNPIPKKSLRMAAARPVLHLLNECSGRAFRETETNLLLIAARMEEPGVDLDGVLAMVRRQCAMWAPNPKMSEYLRPETLFGKTKFDSYYASRLMPLPQPDAPPKPIRPPGQEWKDDPNDWRHSL